ncbi:MAG: flagellar hook capping FlgD N-terminal domain-containing protein [Planctomycetota bacterium]|nr:flagellar hook capping FlgD N-terminal domain-containing protein [Planctomycetota bacterium]
MTIQGISSNDPLYGGSASGGQTLGKDAFMKLLVNQLRYQDPMSPAKNEEFVAQLAQFSSLEQMESLNENIVGLAMLQQSNELMSQLTNSSALIGMSVRFVDPATGEMREGTVDSVRIEDGLAVLNVGGEDVPLALVSEVLGDVEGGDGDSGGGDGSGDGSGDDGSGGE